jgi:hypothetical protein
VRLIALAVVLAALPPTADAAARSGAGAAAQPGGPVAGWTSPLPAFSVLRPFAFDPSSPFRRGAHRGVLLRGAPGARVRAPCAGVVRFAGRHPRLGRGVSIRCRTLTATLLGLATVRVGRGAAVAAGEPVGVLAAAGSLHVGARTTPDRHGYRDPLTLLGAPRGGTPPALAPPPRAVPRGSWARRPQPPRRAPRRPPGPAAPAASPVAWLGLAIAGIAAGLGTTLTVRARGQRRRNPAAVIH